MTTLSKCAEANLILEPINAKCLSMILILISSISRYKITVCSIKGRLTRSIIEEEFFQIVYKNIFCYVLNSCDVTTDILRHCWIVPLCCCMGYNFLSPCPIFSSHCSIMIALYPEGKEAFRNYH